MPRLARFLLPAALLAAALALPSSALAVDCEARVGSTLYTVTSARDVSCADAARDLARLRGAFPARFRTPGRFACVKGAPVNRRAAWRCTRGSEAYRFEQDSRTPPAGTVIPCSVRVSKAIVVTSARGLACTAASRDQERYEGEIPRMFRTPGRFACTKISGGSAPGGQWRCVRGTLAYRFDLSD